MKTVDTDQLAAKLRDLRDISELHGPAGEQLRRDLETLARTDLYLANRLFDTYVPEQLREAPGLKPATLRVAAVIERHFEGRPIEHDRPPVQLYSERDSIVTRPTALVDYEGPIIGRTPSFAVQKVDDDYVLHRHASLSMDPAGLGDNVRIRYPFTGPKSVGLVHERSSEHQHQQQFQKSAFEKDVGIGLEKDLTR